MDIVGYIASALGGGLFTSLVFVFGFSNKISKMAAQLDAFTEDIKTTKERLGKHLENTPTCSQHAGVEVRCDNLESKVRQIEDRLTGKAA